MALVGLALTVQAANANCPASSGEVATTDVAPQWTYTTVTDTVHFDHVAGRVRSLGKFDVRREAYAFADSFWVLGPAGADTVTLVANVSGPRNMGVCTLRAGYSWTVDREFAIAPGGVVADQVGRFSGDWAPAIQNPVTLRPGDRFVLRLRVFAGGASSAVLGLESDQVLSFLGLPTGWGIVSCKGYAQYGPHTLNVPATPGTTGFAIQGVWPNPVRRESPAVRFALDREGDVAAEVFDVAGRSFVRLAAARYGAGEHRLVLPALMRPGVYRVRLTDGRRFASAPLIVSP